MADQSPRIVKTIVLFKEGGAMKVLQKYHNLGLLFLLISAPAWSFNALQKDFLFFEQKLTQNLKTIELLTPKSCELSTEESSETRKLKKEWTFIVYMAADNDLRAFAANNIKQMASVGSNEQLNIVAHLDIKLNGNQKVTRRYFIEKDKINHVNQDPTTQSMDSGDQNTLVSCCEWAIKNYPAKNYALILWNHGTGILDPKYSKIINPAELFSFNPHTNRLELDRSIGFLDLLNYVDLDQRGICWDTTTGNYLTNQKLAQALDEICAKFIHGKFALIGFDACLMAMIEVGHLLKEHALVMVGSQEVELGTGWNYSYILQQLSSSTMSAQELATHIVGSYIRSYQNITNDYTQSALDLTKIHLLERNIDYISTLLLECLAKQQSNSVKTAIIASRSKKTCTHFDEPSYIDLHHFYQNIQSNIGRFQLESGTNLIARLNQALNDGKQIISEVAFANCTGKNLKDAHGISIYFPGQRVHSSYSKTPFAKENNWQQLIEQCL